MEFSGQELEDLQRAAGLLGCTVDELIQQARRPAPAMHTPSRQHHHIASSRDFYQPSPPSQTQALYFPQQAVQADETFLDLGNHWLNPERQSTFSTADRQGNLNTQVNTQVILLNPQTAWYDCNMDFPDILGNLNGGALADQGSSSDSLDQGSFVHVAPVATDSDADSESTAREDGDDVVMEDAGTEWSIVSPNRSTSSVEARSPGTNKRYQSIAPRPGSAVSSLSSRASSSSHKVRKRRSPYEQSSKDDTNLTRSINACVRCRMQRNRVSPSPFCWRCKVDMTFSVYRIH